MTVLWKSRRAILEPSWRVAGCQPHIVLLLLLAAILPGCASTTHASRSQTSAVLAARSAATPARRGDTTKKKKPAGSQKKTAAGKGKSAKRSARRSRDSAIHAAHPARIKGISSGTACFATLRKARVKFERLPKRKFNGVAYPIKVNGPPGGVVFHGSDDDVPTNYLDCRLAATLLAWAPILETAGVTRVDHYSMYRHNAKIAGTRRTSSHAYGLALDAAIFHLRDGSTVNILEDWKYRKRGAPPCENPRREPRTSRLMRNVVCKAAEENLFQIVITPHYNRAHRDHLHLEIRPGEDGPWVR